MSPRPILEREPVFRVNVATNDVTRWEPDGLQGLALMERGALQQWFISELSAPPSERDGFGLLESVIGSPQIGDDHQLGGPLLLLTEEFDQWVHGKVRQPDRLDLLLLDEDGALVVVELKRGVAEETADLQALRYAAFASRLDVDDIEQMLAKRIGGSVEEARDQIADHVVDAIGGQKLENISNVRLAIVAEGFTAPMTTTALFLYEREIDVRCVELTVRKLNEDEVAVAPRLLTPPPQAAALMVKRQREEKAETQTRAATRRRGLTVNVLIEHNAIKPGTILEFATNTLGIRRRTAVASWFGEDERRGRAVWTGERGRRALRWAVDDEHYSVTELTAFILAESLGREPGSVPGPDYWLAPGTEGVVLSVYADQVLANAAVSG